MKLILADVAFGFSCSRGSGLDRYMWLYAHSMFCTAVHWRHLAYSHSTLDWNWYSVSQFCRLTVMASLFPSCLDDLGT